LAEIYRVQLKMEFATLETEVHQDDLVFGRPALAQEILSSLTKMVMQRAKLVNVFAELVPLVRSYVTNRCFGKDVDAEPVRAHLVRLDLREGISNYLARKISELTVEKRVLEFENANFKLSDTRPFSWRRNLPPLSRATSIAFRKIVRKSRATPPLASTSRSIPPSASNWA
jgi:type III restriction enzyme